MSDHTQLLRDLDVLEERLVLNDRMDDYEVVHRARMAIVRLIEKETKE